jgi:hypothetical protein
MRIQRMQLFAGLESDSFAWSYAHFGSRTRVASNAGFTGPHAEDAKSAKLNAIARGESLLETFKDSIDSSFGLRSRQAGALDDVMDNVLLNQWRHPWADSDCAYRIIPNRPTI